MRGASNKHAGKGGCGPFGEKNEFGSLRCIRKSTFLEGPKNSKKAGSVRLGLAVRPSVRLSGSGRTSVHPSGPSVRLGLAVRPSVPFGEKNEFGSLRCIRKSTFFEGLKKSEKQTPKKPQKEEIHKIQYYTIKAVVGVVVAGVVVGVVVGVVSSALPTCSNNHAETSELAARFRPPCHFLGPPRNVES